MRAIESNKIISSDDEENLFANELLVYQEWRARYEVEEQAKEKQERKLEGCFGW